MGGLDGVTVTGNPSGDITVRSRLSMATENFPPALSVSCQAAGTGDFWGWSIGNQRAAASVIHGGHANGLTAWKDSTGITLKEREQSVLSE